MASTRHNWWREEGDQYLLKEGGGKEQNWERESGKEARHAELKESKVVGHLGKVFADSNKAFRVSKQEGTEGRGPSPPWAA